MSGINEFKNILIWLRNNYNDSSHDIDILAALRWRRWDLWVAVNKELRGASVHSIKIWHQNKLKIWMTQNIILASRKATVIWVSISDQSLLNLPAAASMIGSQGENEWLDLGENRNDVTMHVK